MKLLIHVCCGPCSIGPTRQLAKQGHEVTAYFSNPNIHPLLEFRRRLKAVKVLSDRLSSSEPGFAEPVIEEDYGLEPFLHGVYADGAPGRCERCYEMRLAAAARKARQLSHDGFTTTLLISPHQQHDRVQAIGQAIGEREDVEFFYSDFRPLFEASQAAAKKLMLYSQSYCGCIFSEYERYRDTTRHVYRGRDESPGHDG